MCYCAWIDWDTVVFAPYQGTVVHIAWTPVAQVSEAVQSKFDNAGSLKGGVVAEHADEDKLCGKAMQVCPFYSSSTRHFWEKTVCHSIFFLFCTARYQLICAPVLG